MKGLIVLMLYISLSHGNLSYNDFISSFVKQKVCTVIYPWQPYHLLVFYKHTFSSLFFLFQVQLTVTPKVEGTLKLVGVRWKLSGSVIGICNFQSDIVRKKVAKGKRKPKKSLKDNLEFLVIKVSPPPLLEFISFPVGTYL